MPKNRFLYSLMKAVDKLSRYKTTVMTMAVIVVFFTTYLLILPALTLEKTEAQEQGGIDVPIAETLEDSLPDEIIDIDSDKIDESLVDSVPDVSDDQSEGEQNVSGPELSEPGSSEVDEAQSSVINVPDSNMPVIEDSSENVDDPLNFEGENFKVSIVDKTGVLPEGTSISVEKIDENGKAEEYDRYYRETLSALQNEEGGERIKDIAFVSFYDISLISDDMEIEPDEGDKVNVKIEYDKDARKDFIVEDSNNVRIVHFTEDEKADKLTAEVLDAEENNVQVETDNKELLQSAEFEAGSFSVYAVVYTVDFHWEADGQSFEFSIPGGSYISFSKLVETLDITDQDVNTFVANVENIEFSDPDLVWVGKAEEDTTVGDIKSSKGLECEYSSDLTEEQIAEIDAQTVETGDWVLISLQPFTSEESLTVTMLNGDQWTVKVTDAVPGAYPQQVDIEIAGDGSITLSEYVERYDWDWMGDYAYEERQTFYSGRTVDLSVRYGTNRNNQSITANAAPGYVFDHWEKNGTPLTGGDLESEVIPAGTLSFNPHDSLTAVFRPEPESSGGESYTDFDALTEAWKEKITNSKPDVDKTAAVYDYENRIYKVDITASSKLYGVIEDLDLAFVTDVSGSMHFPSKLESAAVFNNEQGMLAQLDSLCRQRHGGTLPSYTGPDEIYYLIMDPQNSSNVYAVRRYNNLWYAFPAGVTDLSPIYAPVLDPNNRYWSRLDTCFDSGGNVLAPFTTPANQIVEKNVYLATDTTQRLEYLREALRLTQSVLYKMDPDAKIGVTTFAGTANRGRLYNNTAQDQNALQNFITNIAVAGGTRQDLGLIEGKALLDTDTSDVKKTVVLITDGAPNGTTWGQIQYQANIIKNAGIDIYTVGLSLENVTGASEGLYNTSSNSIDEQHGFAFDARDGRGLVEAVKSILESLTVHATMVGSVTDTIDSAFYPVDKNGNPLVPGNYVDENGHAYILSKQGDTWTVTWSDQNIEWAQDGASGTQVPGWKGTVYVKAKENFLGGNAIKTNGGTSADKIEITGYKTVIDTDEDDNPIYSPTHQLKNENGTPKTVSETLNTPYVNVDELALTSNDTEWNVYLGTEVDPKDELEKLLKSIEIRKVVSGDTDEMITSAEQMLGGTNASSKTMKLTDYLGLTTDGQISELITALCGGERPTFPYNNSMASAYGHGHVGNIVISLIDTTGCYNKGNHATEAVGIDASFTLKVEYQPKTNTDRNRDLVITDSDYHTTPDGSPGDPVPMPGPGNDMVSTNNHVINVYVKGLRITKKDQPFENEITGAEFKLYRTARDGETENLKEIDGKQFFPVATLDMSSGSKGTIEQVESLKEGEEYYLVETKAPVGYIKLEDPIPVYLAFTNTYITKPDDAESSERPDTAPYNWNQSAILTLGSSEWVHRTDEAGTTDLTQTALSENTQVDTMYYDIANNAGAVLPNAGGIGTTIFYILGTMLVLGCGIYLISRRRIRS